MPYARKAKSEHQKKITFCEKADQLVDVIEIIDTPDTPLGRESAELVFVHEDFFMLPTKYQSARPAPKCK